jgi:hypothetical protein
MRVGKVRGSEIIGPGSNGHVVHIESRNGEVKGQRAEIS